MALLIENYQPAGPTIRDFHLSTKRHRVLIGPIGSGKTTGCMQELYKLITRMPAVQGVRRSRWAITRATTPELQFTTIPQWRSMFDDRFMVEVEVDQDQVEYSRAGQGARILIAPRDEGMVASLVTMVARLIRL